MSSKPESTLTSGPTCPLGEPPKPTRRGFLGSLLGAVVAVTGVTFIYPVLAYLSPRQNPKGQNVLLGVNGLPIHLADVAQQGFVVGLGVNGEATIVMRYANELRAFSAVCTHLGCVVKWNPGSAQFVCPCHAGFFDANGVNMSGPPPTPLKRFKAYATAEGTIGLQEVVA